MVSMTDEERDEFRREALSTVTFLLQAFESVENEAPWFQQAFANGKRFLAENGAYKEKE